MRITEARRKLAETSSRTVRSAPCVLAVLSVIAAQLPLLLQPGMPSLQAAFYVSGFMLLAAFVLPLKKALYLTALPAFLGFLSIFFSIREHNAGKLHQWIPLGKSYGEFAVEIHDAAVSPGTEIPGRPRLIKAKLLSLCLSGESVWHIPDPAPDIGISVPENSLFSPGYGDRYRITGNLTQPEHAVLPGSFDYADYLERSGIQLICYADETEKLSDGYGFSRWLFDLRGKILNRILSGMKSEENQALGAGIFFGFSHDLSYRVKQNFIRSGTIHILTVSGTHIGLFAGLVLLLLAFLPFRQRAVITMLLTFLYAWMTGMREPSFRAFFMLSCFLCARMFLVRTKGVNVLAFSAFILLLYNPYNVLSIGFQFSYIVVAGLILSSPLYDICRTAARPDAAWIPASLIRPVQRLKETVFLHVVTALMSSVTAFVAGIGLSAFHQGLFSGATAAANMLLIPVVWLCFIAAGVAAFFGPVIAFIPESLLSLVSVISSCFSEIGILNFPTPPLWSVFVYMAAFFVLLIMLKRRGVLLKAAAALLLAVMPVYWYFRSSWLPDEALLLYGGSNENVVSVCCVSPRNHSACVLNVPDYVTAREITSFLRSRGITDIRAIALERKNRACSGGLKYLAGRDEETPLIAFDRKNSSFTAVENVLELTGKSGVTHARFHTPDTTVSLMTLPSGHTRFRIRTPGGGSVEEKLPISLNKKYRIFELEGESL